MSEPPIIDHDPDEPPPDRTGNGIYKLYFGALVIFWIAFFLTNELHWSSFALGGATGLFVAVWAIDITGNRVPKWMR